MRKQYHFRVSPEGLLAWDVDRLVALARDLPRERVAVADIRELDEDYWFDTSGQPPTCRQVALHARLIHEADLGYPILLSLDGRVMDGMHRVAKAWMLGHETVLAVRFREELEPDHRGVRPQDLPC